VAVMPFTRIEQLFCLSQPGICQKLQLFILHDLPPYLFQPNVAGIVGQCRHCKAM
jgi:hypothetical protein